MSEHEPQATPDPEGEQEVSRLLVRADALIELSRQERERLEKVQAQTLEADLNLQRDQDPGTEPAQT